MQRVAGVVGDDGLAVALVAASRRFSASLSIGLGLRTVGHCGGDEPRVMCRSPHLLYIWHCATGAHQPSIGLGVPDQDASQGPSSPLGQLVEINTNILPLDLTLHF